MCDHKILSIRHLLWTLTCIGLGLGLLACAGDPPSSVGLLCVEGKEASEGGCWGEGVICQNGFCRDSKVACDSAPCQSNADCHARSCGPKLICTNSVCTAPPNCTACASDADCTGCTAGSVCNTATKACGQAGCGNKACATYDDCATCQGKVACFASKCRDAISCVAQNLPCPGPLGDLICQRGCTEPNAKCVDSGGKKDCKITAPSGHVYECKQTTDCSSGWNCETTGPMKGICVKTCTVDTDCNITGTGTLKYRCFAPPNDTNKRCHLMCNVASACTGTLGCCPKAVPGVTFPFCAVKGVGECPNVP